MSQKDSGYPRVINIYVTQSTRSTRMLCNKIMYDLFYSFLFF